MNKKKLNIYFQRYGMLLKMAISFTLVFVSLLIFCMKSQAYMSNEYLDYICETLSTGNTESSTIDNYMNLLKTDTACKSQILAGLKNQFDIWNIPNIDDSNIIVFGNLNNGYPCLKMFICNNSVPGEYGDLDFYKLKSSTLYKYTNDNSPLYQINIELRKSGSYITIYQIKSWTFSANSTAGIVIGNARFSGDSVLIGDNIACCGIPSGFCYKPLTSSTNIVPIILMDKNGNYHPTTPEPEPSGDTPVISGNTGEITNNSGEKTGQIDLSGIETGISNINQSIQNQNEVMNQNTQTIVNTLSGETQKITNTLTEYDEDEGEEEVSNLISNISSSMSGDLSNSEIFGALDTAEAGFFNLISGQAEDFKISWSDVFFNNIKLIPAGQVNFSALCRDNEALGNIKTKLNIILSALCSIALIKYLYNLFLATFGIDNPYLYEKNDDVGYIKSVDKNTGVTTFKGIDKDGTRWTYKYDPSKKGGRKK